jgi:hypothetical protein
MYNPRVTRFFGLDPMLIKYPFYSTYSYSFNNPIIYNDPGGEQTGITIYQNYFRDGADASKAVFKRATEDPIGTYQIATKDKRTKALLDIISLTPVETAVNLGSFMYLQQQKMFSPVSTNVAKDYPAYYSVTGEPVSWEEAKYQAGLTILLLPVQFVNSKPVRKGIINGVERTLESVSNWKIYPKHLTNKWDDNVIKSTLGKNKPAKFKPEIDVENLDLDVIDTGIKVKDDLYIKKYDTKVGANSGTETEYVKTKINSMGEVHSIPILENDYNKLLKETK